MSWRRERQPTTSTGRAALAPRFAPARQQGGDVGQVVLTVAIQRGHGDAAGLARRCRTAVLWPQLFRWRTTTSQGCSRAEFHEQLHGVVARAVVDEHGLERAAAVSAAPISRSSGSTFPDSS